MLTINSYEEFEKYLGQELGKSDWLEIAQDRINAIWTNYCTWLFDSVIAALYVGANHQGEQSQDDGKLWHGQDEVRPGRVERPKRAPGGNIAQHSQLARHLQGGNQVHHRDKRPKEARTVRKRNIPLSL